MFTERATYRLWVFDPNSYTNRSVFDDGFEDGVSLRASVDFNVYIAGRHGHQSLTAFYSTKDGTDLSTLGDILLPTPDPGAVATKDRRYYFAYGFDQSLYQSAHPGEGCGLFGNFGVSDGNPNGLRWSMYFGIGGTGLIRRGSRDRWGVGYYYDGISDYVKDALPITDEQGVEIFYDFALTPWFSLGADLQVIAPGLGHHGGRSRPARRRPLLKAEKDHHAHRQALGLAGLLTEQGPAYAVPDGYAAGGFHARSLASSWDLEDANQRGWASAGKVETDRESGRQTLDTAMVSPTAGTGPCGTSNSASTRCSSEVRIESSIADGRVCPSRSAITAGPVKSKETTMGKFDSSTPASGARVRARRGAGCRRRPGAGQTGIAPDAEAALRSMTRYLGTCRRSASTPTSISTTSTRQDRSSR